MIRVLVAEDAPVVRLALVAMLRSDPEIQVVGEARTGPEAVAEAERLRPDLVTMAIHLPGMDGLDATKEIMIRAPTPIVIVSPAEAADVELSLSATRAGALTVLATPPPAGSPEHERYRRHLLASVRAMAGVKVVRRWRARAPRPRSGAGAAAVAIAASTGGPAALQRVLMDLPAAFPAPVLITQHISPGFVEALCSWLAASCPLHVQLAEEGRTASAGTVYLAPDGRHLGVEDGRLVLEACLSGNGFCPSADVLFASVGRAYGTGAVGVVLTGMGSDGVRGLRVLRDAGGTVIAQDEATSVVYGMPREATRAGLVDAVLPVQDIAQRLVTLTQGRPG